MLSDGTAVGKMPLLQECRLEALAGMASQTARPTGIRSRQVRTSKRCVHKAGVVQVETAEVGAGQTRAT
jgi:hypothetical protein